MIVSKQAEHILLEGGPFAPRTVLRGCKVAFERPVVMAAAEIPRAFCVISLRLRRRANYFKRQPTFPEI